MTSKDSMRAGLRRRTLQLGVGVARGVEGGPEEEADDDQEHKVERVPEIARDPVPLPLLIVLVRHLQIAHTMGLIH